MSDSNLDESSEQKPTVSKSTVIYDEIVLDDNSDEESQSDLINSNGDTEKVNTPSQCNGNNGNIVDTFTLSSDEEGENVDYSVPVSGVDVKSEAGLEPWKEQISQCIDASIKSKEQETFDEQCKKIEDSFVFLEKEICNIMEQCLLLKESSEKYAYPEIHITGEGDIDHEDASLNIQESVQRIVQIDSIKRKISKDVPIESEDSKINLGDIKKAIEDPEIDIVNMTTLADLQKLYKLPNSGPIVRKPLAIGDQVFAVTDPKNMAKSLWQPATIIETCKISGKIHYNVTFEDSFIPCIFLKGTQLAYRRTPSVMLSNRNRVIAQYPTESSHPLGESNRQFLFSGLIAEVARRINLFRYLVFFDNGSVAYVPCDHVFLIAEENMSFLDDIPEERKPFLKKYFNDYPERALVKYQAGARDYVDIDGKWVPGRVKQVDCSLVRFYFRQFEKYEWLYRGSPRLKPLSGLFKALENPETNGKKRHSRKGTSQSSILGYSRKQRPFVQFVRDEDSLTDDDDKRYSPRSGTKRLDSFESSVEADFELYPEFITKPNRYLVSSPHVPHRCSPSCINISYEDISRYRDTNPYAIPIICGWDRQVACYTNHVKNKRKRTIFYVSPCGRRFRNIEEVDIFLSITKSKLSIDLFTYHPKLVLYSDLNGKTSQGCYYYDADVARGTENHSLSCINWINDEPITPGFKYWPARFAASGVNLELDPHFLVCCDCTDNCRDKSKCECQRLTKDSFEVIRNILGLDDDFGYNHRRLYEAFHTGIWECNTNCACNVNCANRVVQNGIRVRLQIFKTKKKGWGIRCLHDIPPGAFICIYAAEVLNEELADAHGANFGDEYLADLDYIETVENFKEGYEESVYVDLSSDESISPLSSDQESDNYHHKSRGRKKTSKRKGANKKSRKNPERTKKTKKPGKPIRQLYGEKAAYSLDAKRKGNVGRYFNHSCDPNCFVQNVFIDTHDLRFPWVALFSLKFVPAFTELCWDYNYEIIEGRKMWCHCGASNCRGRLL